MTEKVLISGGLGFIGIALMRKLVLQGIAVRLLDNLSPQIHGAIPQIGLAALADGAEVLRGDVCRRSDWASALQGVTSVVHLAAETGTGQSMYRIGAYTSTNVLGTSLLLDVLSNEKHRVKKLILASSRAVYGEGAYECVTCGTVYPSMRSGSNFEKGQWDPPCPSCGALVHCVATPETAKTNPSSIYAATKLAQEDLVRVAASAQGIPFSILRFQNVYGEGQSLNNPYTGILSIFSNRVRQGKSIALYEDGQESRDFVHVSDAAEAVSLSLLSERGDGLTMNVGSGVPVTVKTVAGTIKRHLGDLSETVVSGQFRKGDIRHCYADLSTIRKALGFRPAVPLEEGIGRFARWVKTQPIAEDGLDRADRELIERGLMKA